MEIWRDIQDYSGLYQVSNLGNFKRLAFNYKHYTREEHLLKPSIGKNGYLRVTLTKNSICKCFLAHRIVALTFLPNKENYRCVNHKNENKTDNRIENLEWCSHYQNNHYGTAEKKNYKPVIGVSAIDGKELYFESIKNAAETLKITPSNIGSCCKGNRKTAGGYKWKYVNEKK